MNYVEKITPETPTVLGHWLWHAEKKEWHDAATLGLAARRDSDLFGYTHMIKRPRAEDALKEACDWIQVEMAAQGHPCPASFVFLVQWRDAIRPPQIRP